MVMILSVLPFDLKLFNNNPKFGLVTIDEPIISSRDIILQLDEFNDDDSIEGIILRLNTPGGTVAPSQEIYEKVKSISESNSKPIIASISSIAASGGYYIAVGADTVMANKGSLTGSIGVVMNYPIMIDFLKHYGFDYKTVKSGSLKDSGSAFRQPTIVDSLYFQQIVDNMHNQFLDVLKYERSFTDQYLKSIAKGQVYTGLQAKELKLIDLIGTFENCVELLLKITGHPNKTAQIIDNNSEKNNLLDNVFSQILKHFKINKILFSPLPEFQLYYQGY